MDNDTALNVQCFCKKRVSTAVCGRKHAQAAVRKRYPSSASTHPRVMHAHEDFAEIILICSGSSEYLIHDKKYFIQPGDLLIYNAAWFMMRSPARIWKSAATA